MSFVIYIDGIRICYVSGHFAARRRDFFRVVFGLVLDHASLALLSPSGRTPCPFSSELLTSYAPYWVVCRLLHDDWVRFAFKPGFIRGSTPLCRTIWPSTAPTTSPPQLSKTRRDWVLAKFERLHHGDSFLQGRK